MRTTASVGSWIAGSGTVSTRTSRLPWKVRARMGRALPLGVAWSDDRGRPDPPHPAVPRLRAAHGLPGALELPRPARSGPGDGAAALDDGRPEAADGGGARRGARAPARPGGRALRAARGPDRPQGAAQPARAPA